MARRLWERSPPPRRCSSPTRTTFTRVSHRRWSADSITRTPQISRPAHIDVLKGTNGTPDLVGNFTDPGLPAGYAPFNVQNLGGTIYVAYALNDGNNEDVSGAGHGFVTQFDMNGNFIRRLISGGDPGLAVGARHRSGRLWLARGGPPGRKLRRRPDPRLQPPHRRAPRHAHGRDQQSNRDRGSLGASCRQRRKWRRSSTKSISLPVQTRKPAVNSEAWPAPAPPRAPCRSQRRSYSSAAAWLRR